MRTLYTKLPLLLVLLLVTIKQNDLAKPINRFIAFQQQPGASKTPEEADISSLHRISHNVSFRYVYPGINYVGQRCVLSSGHDYSSKPAKINIALVTVIIKVPLPISHLPGVVASCTLYNRSIAGSGNACGNNVLGIPPGEGTIIASLALC